MTTDIFQLVLPDIPRFYTALAEWLACFVCVFWLKRRVEGWKFVFYSGAALGIQSLFLILTGGLDGIWWILCMLAAIGMMYLYIMLCGDLNWKDGLYYCVGAFVAAEAAASLEWQFYCFFYYVFNWEMWWMQYACLCLIYGLFYALMWWIYRGYRRGNDALHITNRELISYIVIGIAVFSLSNLGFVSVQTPFTGRYMAEIFRVRTIIDLGGVAILYAYHIQRMELRARHELENMQTILKNQYLQYQQSKEAIDIINYKYHDLKHHIIALRAEENTEKRNQYLDKMEEEIRTYEAWNKTGNKVVDTILTAKNLYCMKNSITMTSVVDGTLFTDIDPMDVCSIFGNALDNAIEYEKKIKEKEKRLIHVTAHAQHNFRIICFENYCEDSIDFQGELPVTTKKDEKEHGYGTKSLQYTVRKYGGNVNFELENNWFIVKILIPMDM